MAEFYKKSVTCLLTLWLSPFFLNVLISLKGEHSITFLSKVFAKLDHESDYNLSKRKTKKDRQRWCVDEAFCFFFEIVTQYQHSVFANKTIFLGRRTLCMRCLASLVDTGERLLNVAPRGRLGEKHAN